MQVTLDHTEDVAHNIKTFWFKPAKLIRHTAGQFVELTINHDNVDDRGTRRWFTLSSSPSEAPLVSITTKFAAENGSSFKQALHALKPGDNVSMSMPMGDFVLPKDKNRSLLFIAGGIGITPFRSIIKSLIDNNESRNITLLYSAQETNDFAFKPLFKQPWLNVTYQTERLTTETVFKLVPDAQDRIIYMSGPEPMVEAMVKDFKQAGVASHHLIGDYFPNYPQI